MAVRLRPHTEQTHSRCSCGLAGRRLAVWYILLDQSFSMNDTFRATAEQSDLRAHWSSHARKFDAAKEALLIELDRLPPDASVAIIAFTSTATLIHTGIASDHEAFRQALATREPFNGTDIAAALDETLRLKGIEDNRPGSVPATFNRILVITDGLSDPAAARQSAQQCATQRIVVDVILIDPSERGEKLARSITEPSGGRWDKVFGPTDLGAATQRAREEAALAATANEMLTRAAEEAKAFAAENVGRRPLHFTAVHPVAIEDGATDYLAVFVHLESMRKDLEGRIQAAQAFLSEKAARGSAKTEAMIAKGTIITLRPELARTTFRPEVYHLPWSNRLSERWFEFTRSASDTSADITGSVRIQIGGVTIGEIPITIRRKDRYSRQGHQTVVQESKMLQDVFASYSRKDAAIVERCRAVYKALGIRLIVDRKELRAGQYWDEVIGRWIDEADAFQLYWSSESRDSEFVQLEIHRAVSVAKTRSPKARFIRPLYWSDDPAEPIPGPLAALHFERLAPDLLGAGRKTKVSDLIRAYLDTLRSRRNARRSRLVDDVRATDEDRGNWH
jgi:hypothetical protein